MSSQQKGNQRNPVAKQLGDVIGVRRYKQWLEQDRPRKFSMYIDKEQLQPYAAFVPLTQFYNGDQILQNAKKSFHNCVDSGYTEKDANKLIEQLDEYLRVTVQVQIENPMRED
jgi:hypothetical protein